MGKGKRRTLGRVLWPICIWNKCPNVLFFLIGPDREIKCFGFSGYPLLAHRSTLAVNINPVYESRALCVYNTTLSYILGTGSYRYPRECKSEANIMTSSNITSIHCRNSLCFGIRVKYMNRNIWHEFCHFMYMLIIVTCLIVSLHGQPHFQVSLYFK